MFHVIFLMTALFASNAQASGDDWICKHIASEKRGNSIAVCGVSKAPDEQKGMENAMYGAQNEFNQICSMSSDCNHHKMDVEAKRSECEAIPEVKDAFMPGTNYYKFTCYRLVIFTIKE